MKDYKYKKECELCGETFKTNRKSKIYCKTPHPVNCAVCNEVVNINKPQRGRKEYPCKKQECRSEMTRRTNIKKYGVPNVAQAKSVQESIKKTNLEKYGVEHAFQSDEVKKKIKQTNIERYGTENPRWGNEESRLKAEKTNLERYGHINPFGGEEIKKQIMDINLEKYGVPWTTQAEEVKEKMRETWIEKYGVDNPAKSKEVQDKMKQTILERYGAENYMSSEIGFNKYSESIFDKYGVYNYSHLGIENYNDYLNLEEFLINTDMDITELALYFNAPRRLMRKRIIELGLQTLFEDLYVTSVSEADFESFLINDEQLKNIDYKRNDRIILKGKELDFYFPGKNLAVEISPIDTHNSKFGWGNREPGLPSTYHINKFLECEKQGIELITIFDWHDWDKVLEMIKNKLGGSQETIYARKTKYTESTTITDEIFDKISSWHILSLPSNIKKKSDVSILSYKNEPVGLALWGDIEDGVVELKRMVFKPGISVVGGASKLIKNYHRDKPDIKEIYTFSDCDLGGGSVYQKVGFELIEESKPVLSYYSKKYDKHIKHLSLVRQGADRLLRNIPDYVPVGIGEGLPSNKEIVESYGFLPIYDCGYKKWSLVLNQ